MKSLVLLMFVLVLPFSRNGIGSVESESDEAKRKCRELLAEILPSLNQQAWPLREGARSEGDVNLFFRVSPALFSQLQITASKLGRSETDVAQRALALFAILSDEMPDLYRSHRPIADLPLQGNREEWGDFLIQALRESGQFPEFIGPSDASMTFRIPHGLKQSLDVWWKNLRISQEYFAQVSLGLMMRVRNSASTEGTHSSITQLLNEIANSKSSSETAVMTVKMPIAAKKRIEEIAHQNGISYTRLSIESLRFSLGILER